MSARAEKWIGVRWAACEEAWHRFWFTPQPTSLLGVLRIGTGLLLLYTHLVWTLELDRFFGPRGVLPRAYGLSLYGDAAPLLWTHFDLLSPGLAVWGAHAATLLVMLLMTVGLWTRLTSWLSFLLVVSYAHRATGALFGLDQVNGFLALYLAMGPSGQSWSIDAWRRGRVPPNPCVSAGLALRLIQVHLCVVYLFAGLSKLQGVSWWSGQAIWEALASRDYQSWDLTFLAHAPGLLEGLTLVTLAWEISYVFLIWNEICRPWLLGLAVVMHLAIGSCLGMLPFGLIMIVANLAFLPPSWGARGLERRAGTTGAG